MNIIEDVYEKSGHDELFQRHNVYDINSFKKLFTINGFLVATSGTYFLKLFSHNQLIEMMTANFIDKTMLDGFNKMTKYFPDNGAEIFINSIIS